LHKIRPALIDAVNSKVNERRESKFPENTDNKIINRTDTINGFILKNLLAKKITENIKKKVEVKLIAPLLANSDVIGKFNLAIPNVVIPIIINSEIK
jgi:hypothetical protein